jgi:hypothetical protein
MDARRFADAVLNRCSPRFLFRRRNDLAVRASGLNRCFRLQHDGDRETNESSRCARSFNVTPNEVEYYRRRALAERINAAEATTLAADVHLKLASLYEQIVALGVDDDPMPCALARSDRELVISSRRRVEESRKLLQEPVLGLPPATQRQ